MALASREITSLKTTVEGSWINRGYTFLVISSLDRATYSPYEHLGSAIRTRESKRWYLRVKNVRSMARCWSNWRIIFYERIEFSIFSNRKRISPDSKYSNSNCNSKYFESQLKLFYVSYIMTRYRSSPKNRSYSIDSSSRHIPRMDGYALTHSRRILDGVHARACISFETIATVRNEVGPTQIRATALLPANAFELREAGS